MMVRFKRIEVNNYRSCVDTKIEINNPLTALIGINGSGKSNILNSIQLLKKINRNRFYDDKDILSTLSHTVLKLLITVDDQEYNLRADIYFESNEKNIDEVYYSEMKLRRKGLRKWTKIDPDMYDMINRIGPIRFRDRFSKLGAKIDGIDYTLISEIIIYFYNISYYSATQFSDPAKSPVSLELENSRPLGRLNSSTHERFIYDLYSLYKSNRQFFKRYIDTVNKNGIGLVDDINFFEHSVPSSTYEVKAGGKIRKIERDKNIVIPSISLDTLTLSPNQLSEGTFKTLALVFYILNDESELMLIEEPEVCVHHGLLNSIIELIKSQSNKKQIMISTHSDFILDKLKPENILLISKDKKLGTIAQTLNKSLSKQDYNALKQYLNESGNLGEYWKEGGFDNE